MLNWHTCQLRNIFKKNPCHYRAEIKAEMKIYYKKDDNEIGDDDFASTLNEQLNTTHRYILIICRYQIMWALRFIENEINNSDGIIIIDMPKINDLPKVSIKGFSQELGDKVKDILSSVKLSLN